MEKGIIHIEISLTFSRTAYAVDGHWQRKCGPAYRRTMLVKGKSETLMLWAKNGVLGRKRID